MRKVVVSLGGSILVKGEGDVEYISDLRSMIVGMTKEMRFIIVTGGGRLARDYIGMGRELGSDEATLDLIGIESTRLNSWLLISALGPDCYPRPFITIEESLQGISTHCIVVGGGTHPGHTTDAVSALIAERWRADIFVNMTSVPGAFTSDPNRDRRAKRIPEISTTDLVKLVSAPSSGAGSHSVMDPLAARIVERSAVPTFIIDGRDLGSLKGVLTGGRFKGTAVLPVLQRGD